MFVLNYKSLIRECILILSLWYDHLVQNCMLIVIIISINCTDTIFEITLYISYIVLGQVKSYNALLVNFVVIDQVKSSNW